ncbi:MAG: tRNA (uridine(34)/cytosine(34)/5-carboxymethylaminomethyluridine(34)-2'-O)-methyltransferase TrmL [Pseudomonadales bacterium]
MFNVVLFEPEIPPNTGNIIRLCANAGCDLHLVKPLGFEWEDKRLRRAGLDYREWANVQLHDSLEDFLRVKNAGRVFAVSTKGSTDYCTIDYRRGDSFLFGPETRGLSDAMRALDSIEQTIRIPMVANSRSLNLSNSVAVLVYEAWRQCEFAGAGGVNL